ncbi:SPOR domain-containing protein [Paenibacillus psychroresistens]|uniref:SPOR domain-containing protein n=1 Tax=Paenibacillus psychroresistens TaxID=1778678 RepID=A0A6B8RHJ8_9BACL|nr:SPOR domain-containing protein [Paenibacillus psychroresistens]QGQ95387.1 SPOR domain-containing protein [Paenibacillus psychroresistens]
MNKTRITYRLDNQAEKPLERISQEERKRVVPLYEDEFRVVNEGRPLPEYTTDYGAWNSPIDAETKRIEQLIRESNMSTIKKKPPRANEDLSVYEIEQRFRHEEYSENSTHTTSGTMYMRRNIPWFKVAGTAVGAVVTGILLGYLILTMFTGDNPPQDKTAITDDTKAITDDAPKEVSVTLPSEVQAGVIPVQIPARTYTFLQNGGFSTQERADQAGADIRNQGIAAVTEAADKFFVYVGVAVDRNSALTLSEQLQTKNLEIYKKPYSLPALQEMKWNGNAEFLQTYCTQADQLVQMLSGITLVHLEESELTAISDSTLQSIQSNFETWTQTSSQVFNDATADIKPTLQKLTNAMNTAKLSLDEYKKSPSFEMLWQTQTNILQFIITEKALLTDIASV